MTKNQDNSDNCEVETITLQKWRECFRDNERDLYQNACARELAGGYDWQDYIMYLEILPKLVLRVLSIDFEPTNDDEAKMWVELLRNWSTKAKWIDHLKRKNEQSPEPLVGDPDWVNHFKPQSELSIAFLNLCIELYPRSPELQELTPYPSKFWYSWEQEKCLASIQSTGLLPELYHRRPPKDRFYKEASATAKWLSDISPLSKDEEVFPEGIKPGHTCNIESLIITLAAKTAQAREDKAFRNAYCKFYKAIRSAARYVRNHECFGSHEMRNGKIVEAGLKGKRQSRIAEQEYQPGVGYVTSPHVTKSLHETD